jgi:hypothetical protein
MKSLLGKLSIVSAGLMTFAGASQASATLYAADNLTDGSLNGVLTLSNDLARQAAFITPGNVAGIATNGTSVYVSLPAGISEYGTGGQLIRSYANVGTDKFGALAFSGSNLYAADNLTDGSLFGVLTLNSQLQRTGAFLTQSAIAGLATDGSSIFASLTTGIFRYSFSGEILDSYLNIGTDRFGALSFAGGFLYAADNLTDGSLSGVLRLDRDLNRVGAFITAGPISGLAADGTNVYASLDTGIARYNNDGLQSGFYQNVGTDRFGALAVFNAAVPEPATWSIMVLGFGVTGAAMRRSRKVVATA